MFRGLFFTAFLILVAHNITDDGSKNEGVDATHKTEHERALDRLNKKFGLTEYSSKDAGAEEHLKKAEEKSDSSIRVVY